jgi:hypothetical protein
VMRVVVRESFSRDMAEMLVDDMRLAYAHITGEPLVPKAAKKAQSQRGGC